MTPATHEECKEDGRETTTQDDEEVHDVEDSTTLPL